VVHVVENAENMKLLERFEELVVEFRRIVTRANAPVNCLCCRSNCSGLKVVNIFHSNDQLEYMLEKNFDGRQFNVKSQGGVKLDCMFFPFNDEKVRTVQEMKVGALGQNNNQAPVHLHHPTIIFFNPNAQCYQQQVHNPNAFWLKFFVKHQMNVMAWNYRDYGRSGGTPDPYCSYHDGESILKFLIEDLGVKGKIGCFGRSLGGTMATHLACNYP